MAMLKYPAQENISALVVVTVSEQQKTSMLCVWIVTNNLCLNNYKFTDKRFVLSEKGEYMIKKFKEEIHNINDVVSNIQDKVMYMARGFRNIEEIKERVTYISNNKEYLENKVTGIIESQQKTIKTLTDALCNKYEHGLFIYSEDGKMPMVIRNGKPMTDRLTQSFSIDWTPGEMPNINIEQVAGTWEGDENCN